MADSLQKKVVLLGTPGVGKTSLTRQFVESVFDEKYHTTIGVKVDKKRVVIGSRVVQLVIWDIAGPEHRFAVPTSYIRGAAGYLVVADGTRPETLDDGLDIVRQVEREIGRLPFVLLLNKADLVNQWRIEGTALGAFRDRGCRHFRTSARTGEGVEEAFQRLTEDLVAT